MRSRKRKRRAKGSGEGGGVRGAGQGGKSRRAKMIDQKGVAYNRDGKRKRGKLKGEGRE